MELADWVRTMRQKQGMTQGQLAKLCDLTQATISRIESGELKRVRIDTLVRLRLMLGIPPDILRKMGHVWEPEEPTPDADSKLMTLRIRNLSPQRRAALKSFLILLEKEDRFDKGL